MLVLLECREIAALMETVVRLVTMQTHISNVWVGAGGADIPSVSYVHESIVHQSSIAASIPIAP